MEKHEIHSVDPTSHKFHFATDIHIIISITINYHEQQPQCKGTCCFQGKRKHLSVFARIYSLVDTILIYMFPFSQTKQDVSNRGVSNSKSLKSKVTKPSHKRNVATIYKSTDESSSLVVHKKTVATKSTKQQPVEYIDIPILKHGLDSKRSTSNKSFQVQSKLHQPTKVSSSAKPTSLSKPKPSYQDGVADDIDSSGSNDPLLVTKYISEMYTYHRSEEHRAIVGPYLDSQPEINQRMRSILVDWLVDVHYKMKFFPETLYITVNIVDRFLAKKEVPRRKLQLVGVTSFLIASKYEEIYPPDLYDLVYVCDNAYSKQEVRFLSLSFRLPSLNV